MNPLAVSIRMFDSEIEHPSYNRPGDAALDLRSTIDAVIEPGQRQLIPCGFAIELPEGYCGLVLPRSGLAIHDGISVLNAPGLIDANYRGEVSVILINNDAERSFSINRGDRIAQLLIVATPTIRLQCVTTLSETERGEAGFGSSGRA